jgi:hypothetical protein
LDREYAQSGVWSAAARRLVALHRTDPTLPLDPELYVVAQDDGPGIGLDPWKELSRSEAVRRYRRLVARIVRSLRDELRGEVRAAERKLRAGEPLAHLLASLSPRFSALGRFIVASRAGRTDLAELFIPAARTQHRACPLYRRACQGLIPDEDYPVFDLVAEWPPLHSAAEAAHAGTWSLN